MRKLAPRPQTRIAAKIPPEMRAALVAEAKLHGVSESAVLRWALTAYLPSLQNGPVAPTEKAS